MIGSEMRLLIDAVEQRSTTRHSRLHGPQHWRAVAMAGLRLIQDGTLADPAVILLFALFHDALRVRDGRDPDHGARAAALAQALQGRAYQIQPQQLTLLTQACEAHELGYTSPDATIGACWDADRLNLWRVGRIPSPRLLSTAAARRFQVIAWARTLHNRAPNWDTVVAQFIPYSI